MMMSTSLYRPNKAAAVAIGDDIAFFGHQAVGFLGGVGVDAGLGGQLAAAGHGVAVLHGAQQDLAFQVLGNLLVHRRAVVKPEIAEVDQAVSSFPGKLMVYVYYMRNTLACQEGDSENDCHLNGSP